MTKARECGTKHRHPSSTEAHRAVWNKVQAGAGPAGRWHVYRCRFCRSWHIGHAPTYRGQP